MTVNAMPGNVRFRALQLGDQTTFGTPVAATRRMPWRFTPTLDPHWTSPDVDTGTLDPAIAPYRMATDITGQAVGPLAANDAQALWSGFLKATTPSGPVDSLYTWDYAPASTSADAFQLMTAEWGDETTDVFRYSDAVVDQLQLSFPQDLGPIMATADLRFGDYLYPHTFTAGLSVDTNPTWLYAADTLLSINDLAGSIGLTPLVNSMHEASIQMQANIDVKRFSNGSNGNFKVAGYGRGARTMQSTFTLAKSTQALAEVVKWLNDNPQERFVQLETISRKTIGVASHAAQRIRFAGYWFTRSEGAIGSNTTVQLVCNHVYDASSGLAPIGVRVKNSAATLLPA